MKGLGQIIAVSALALTVSGAAWAAGATLSKGQAIRPAATVTSSASGVCCTTAMRATRSPKGGVAARQETTCQHKAMQTACTCPAEAARGGCCTR